MSCSSSSLIPKNGLGGMLTLTEATLFHCPPILNVRYFLFFALIVRSSPNWCVAALMSLVPTASPLSLTSDRMLVLSCVVLVSVLPPSSCARMDGFQLVPSGVFYSVKRSTVEVLNPSAMEFRTPRVSRWLNRFRRWSSSSVSPDISALIDDIPSPSSHTVP